MSIFWFEADSVVRFLGGHILVRCPEIISYYLKNAERQLNSTKYNEISHYFALFPQKTPHPCPVQCDFHINKNRLNESDAVIFHLPTFRKLPKEKREGQSWVLFCMERYSIQRDTIRLSFLTIDNVFICFLVRRTILVLLVCFFVSRSYDLNPCSSIFLLRQGI